MDDLPQAEVVATRAGRTLFIINPAGHGGTGTTTWERFQACWPHPIPREDVIITQRPGQARDLAFSAEGYETLAAVGGDGTVGDVMSGILDRPDGRPQLAIVPAGTGNDIARTVGIGSISEAARAMSDGQLRAFDMMRVEYSDGLKRKGRHGFLLTAVGFSAIPMIKPWMKRVLGPTGAYYLGTFLQIILYRPTRMVVRADGREQSSGRTWMVIVGNSEYSSGGSMRISPGASTEDGELNISVFPVLPRLKMILKLLPKVATGDHINEPGVAYFPAKRIEVESDPPAILDIDGDVFGTTPVTFRVCPGALRVLTLRV